MAIDWTKIFKRYKGMWIALKEDEKTVISSGKTARVVYSKAKEKGHENPIITRMPRNLHTVVGSNL